MQLITGTESRAARKELSLSQADLASATGLNRVYVSDFENGNINRFTDGQLRKLRQFYEAKIREANANGEEIALTFGEPELEVSPQPTQSTLPAESTAAAPYRFWPVFLEVPQPIAVKALGMVQDNDARIAVLLKQAVEREGSFLGLGENSKFAAATVEALQEAIGLFAANYALFRSLSGWPALGLTPSNEDLETLRDVIFATFQQQFEAAGLLAEPAIETEGAE